MLLKPEENKTFSISDLTKVEMVPAKLDLRVAELRSWAQGLADKYKGLVFTEEQVPEVRKDMAELNKAAELLDSARITTKKKAMEPITAFEAMVNDIREIILGARRALAAQVDTYEQAEREKRKGHVTDMVNKALEAANLTGALEIPIQEKWLAKSATIKSIKADIQGAIDAHLEALAAKERQETAKKERALAVEQKARDLGELLGVEISMAECLNLLDVAIPLAEAYARLERMADVKVQEKNRKAAELEAARVTAEPPATAPASEGLEPEKPSPTQDKDPGPMELAVEEKGYTEAIVSLKFKAENEAKVKETVRRFFLFCHDVNVVFR